MFDADRPITTHTQDRLNRALFSKYLARCMLDHKDPESLVVGLYGGWGVGKTSVINLVVEELNFAATNLEDAEKPIILNFSPWSYSGQNELVYSFFRRLSSALRNTPYLENKERIIHLLELYVSFFTHKPIPKALRANHSWWKKIFHHHDIHGWESGRDLTLVKAELNDLLRHQKHKIIIIIDNISRLFDYEIKQIFQIVKSMGDYANTAYLLAIDKPPVIRAINKIDGGGGEAFIEKIVQLPFDIPPIMSQDLENILADRLNEIVSTVPENTWNNEYWADIYYSSLKFFFENCRDITRYVNTLSFSYSRLRDIVNPVDFFALTAIEVFTPEVYFGIRDNKDLFTDLLDNVYELDSDQRQKDKIRCDEILGRNNRLANEVLLDLLLRLFPRLQKIYQTHLNASLSDENARKLKRIASPDLFDAYFRLSMQSSQIQSSEFDTLLGLSSDPKAFDQALTRLNQDGRILKFLDLLDSKIILTVPENNIQSIINSLIDNGDLFPQGMIGPLSLDTPMRIHRIIHSLLQRSKDDYRLSLMKNATEHANKSLYIIVRELQELFREHSSEESFLPPSSRDLTLEELNTLKEAAVQQIKCWARDQRLIDHPKLLSILSAWANWGYEDECRAFVKEATNTDRGLLSFLTASFAPAIKEAMTDHIMRPSWMHYLDEINTFIAPRDLEEHAKTLFEDQYFEKLREEEQLALMIFLDLRKANTNKTIPNTTN